MFGTLRYASYNASRGVEQSRRDDLESIGHMLINLYTGILPWNGIDLRDKLQMEKKYSPCENICKNMPEGFLDYYKYCRN